MAVPTKDSELVDYSTNFDTRITAAPATFGLSAGQAASYSAVHDPYIVAYNAISTPGARSKSLVAAKDAAKAALLPVARELYGLVQANTSVSAANKELLGVKVRDVEPTPVPPPAFAPAMEIVSVNGYTVRVRLHDSQTPSRRGRPPGTDGATVFSFIGDTPPVDMALWRFEGSTGKTSLDIQFPVNTPSFAKVWICAFWFNPSKESGPACAPVDTNLGTWLVQEAA